MGRKKIRNQPENDYGEVKNTRVSARVTPTGYRLFVEKVKELQLSIAEFIERVARGKIRLVPVYDSLTEVLTGKDLESLVDVADLPIERLQQFQKGEAVPSPSELVGLAAALGMKTSDLDKLIKHQEAHHHDHERC